MASSVAASSATLSPEEEVVALRAELSAVKSRLNRSSSPDSVVFEQSEETATSLAERLKKLCLPPDLLKFKKPVCAARYEELYPVLLPLLSILDGTSDDFAQETMSAARKVATLLKEIRMADEFKLGFKVVAAARIPAAFENESEKKKYTKIHKELLADQQEETDRKRRTNQRWNQRRFSSDRRDKGDRYDNRPQGGGKAPPGCFICSKPDHYARECPQRHYSNPRGRGDTKRPY